MTGFRCEHLTKNLGEYQLKDVSFMLEPGLVLGVIGINGSGKTTLLRSILGSYRLDQSPEDRGELWLEDKHYRKDTKAYRQNIAYVLQSNPYSDFMHPVEIGEQYGHFYPGFDLNQYKELLEKYEVPRKKMITELSKGQKLRIQLAFAMSYPAKLYVFDEPVGNLDVEFRDTFYEAVRELAAKDCCIILSSHLVTELEHVADKILWIGKEKEVGFVRFFGSLDELRDSYRLLSVDEEMAKRIPTEMIYGQRLRETHKEYLLGARKHDDHTTGEAHDNQQAIPFDDKALPAELRENLRYPDLQEIMYFVER